VGVALEDEDPPPIGTEVGVGVIGLEASVYCSGSRAFAGPFSSVYAYMRWGHTETEPASGTVSRGVLCLSSYPDLTRLFDVDSLSR
jgi:hypothetical protein